jgi:uncharacterized protein HemX
MIKLFKANQSEQTIAQLQQLCRDLDAKLTETELSLDVRDKEIARLRKALGEIAESDCDCCVGHKAEVVLGVE